MLISSGPTREPIDAVRFLSNYSTGFLGECLAREAVRRGHRVTVVSGPTDRAPLARATTIQVERAAQMQRALRHALPRADVLIMAAAVCDFRPVPIGATKLARRGRVALRRQATPDIGAGLHVPFNHVYALNKHPLVFEVNKAHVAFLAPVLASHYLHQVFLF